MDDFVDGQLIGSIVNARYGDDARCAEENFPVFIGHAFFVAGPAG